MFSLDVVIAPLDAYNVDSVLTLLVVSSKNLVDCCMLKLLFITFCYTCNCAT